MSKKIAVLFSGGLDSTYLMWKNLKEGNKVFPIYIEIKNNQEKSIIEKNRVKLLYEEFKKEFNVEDKLNIYSIQFVIDININRSYDNGLTFGQIPIWILASLFTETNEIDEFQIGYVMNDDAISYLKDIKNVYKSYQPFFPYQISPLVFPLIKTKKQTIIDELPQNYLNLTITCENPTIIGSKDADIIDYKPCRSCVSCKKIIADELYTSSKQREYYENELLNKYAGSFRGKGYKVVDKENKECFKVELLKTTYPYQLEIDWGGDNVDIESYKKI